MDVQGVAILLLELSQHVQLVPLFVKFLDRALLSVTLAQLALIVAHLRIVIKRQRLVRIVVSAQVRSKLIVLYLNLPVAAVVFVRLRLRLLLSLHGLSILSIHSLSRF